MIFQSKIINNNIIYNINRFKIHTVQLSIPETYQSHHHVDIQQ
mgnify:CR=1 FL=1